MSLSRWKLKRYSDALNNVCIIVGLCGLVQDFEMGYVVLHYKLILDFMVTFAAIIEIFGVTLWCVVGFKQEKIPQTRMCSFLWYEHTITLTPASIFLCHLYFFFCLKLSGSA